ncbi:alpha/beta hydrolase family protein [Parasphingopyxis marina]|uniref:S9 family peptidase n=1 Tax=Parasphingopyxis marina TaxID=2761622 RepID=A0A842HXY8_9SPHN|nr:S9 family peptidase [Parasphingopyxis marina]MBC2779048.1 S9 family peptidase [Parasphingopyxis marina]
MLKRIVAVIVLAIAATAAAEPAAGPERVLTGSDLFSLEVAADPQISPDGRWIAYVRRSGDIMTDRFRPTIWLVDTRSGEQVPIAAGPGSHMSPRWSPDGRRLAYISSAEGEASQLFVRWMASGEAVRLTGLPNAPGSIAWSPDGRNIAYAMLVPGEAARLGSRPDAPEGAEWADPLDVTTAISYRADGAGYLRPGFSQIFVVPADGGAARQLSFGNYQHDGPLSWSADGRTILFSGNLTPDWELDPIESEVYALDVATSAITPLTDRDGPDASPAASPDGRHIAWLGFDDQRLGYQNVELYVANPDGSGRRSLTSTLDRSIGAVDWAADSRALYIAYDDHGRTRVARVSLSGDIRTVAEGLTGASLDRPYSGGGFSVARDGTVAITGGPATRPADVVLVRGGNRRQLTHLNDGLLAGKTMGEVRHIETASSFDGRTIEGWLTLPPHHVEGQRHPLILEIHGGPFAAYGPHFSTDNQLYAAAGYAVLSVNPRGSTSYGAEFANLIHHAYPGHDYDDLMSAVDAAIAQGYADPDQLFVTGGSGGGVLTSWIVGNTNRFRAAATQKPVINWTTQALVSDIPVFVAQYWFGALPWEDQQSYWARSPLSLVGNVETPTLVVVGSEDERTPVSEAEQYYMALRMEGVPTTLVRVPGASHGGIAARPSQSAAKASAILAWFDRYRTAAPSAP